VRNSDERITRELLSGEALYILKNLRDNKSGGRSNKLADVKTSLEPTVTIEFDNYFFFLRKYNFIAMDREACLQLTGEGEKVLDGVLRDRFGEAIGEYFASRLGADPADSTRIRAMPPPPPPPRDDRRDASREETPAPIKLHVQAPDPAEANIESAESAGAASDNSPFEPPAPPPRKGRSKTAPQPEMESPVPQPPPRSAEAPRPSTQNEVRGAPAASGGELDGRYAKGELLGSGPLGQVFKGKQLSTGVDVALKELKDIFGYFSFLQRSEVMKRLKKELQAQAAVRHPAMVQVLELNLDTARPYFALELCSGSLRDEMTESDGKGLKVPAAIRFFLQVCYGLRAAHASGLTHQNLKPENVLVDPLGNAKLADFGLTRVIEVDSTKGMPQVIVGTGGMGYLPPELLSRQKNVGPSADVYSLGILFYELLTGMLPGRRSPLPSQARKEVPTQLDAIFDHMTQDRTEERLPDVDAVLTEFYAAFPGGEWLKKGDLVLSSESASAGAKSKPEETPAS
jgi:serine/threonine protein kinase